MSIRNLAKRVERLKQAQQQRQTTWNLAAGIPREMKDFVSRVWAEQPITDEEWATWDKWKREIAYPWINDKSRKDSPKNRAQRKLWSEIYFAELPRDDPTWKLVATL